MTRGEQAKEYFMQGYNCSQSVAMAYSDLINMDKDTIAILTGGFGGGMGRMREVCGAVSGAVFILSALNGYNNPADSEGKKALYADIQKIGNAFKNENSSIICKDLLGLTSNGFDSPIPNERNANYYKKRPCQELVKSSADILDNFIKEKE